MQYWGTKSAPLDILQRKGGANVEVENILHEREHCDFSCTDRMCVTLDKAGVPTDEKWRTLVLYMRNIDTHSNLNRFQRKQIQQHLVEVIRERQYSDEQFTQLLQKNLKVLNAPLEKKLAETINESGRFLEEFRDLIQRRSKDVSGLGDFTVDAIQNEQEPRELILKLRLAFKEVTSSMENDVRRLAELSTTDALTGLLNRRALDDNVQREITRAAKTKQPLSFILLDIDHFKRFNDTYGHRIGDQALITVARIITRATESFKKIDPLPAIAARYGGEEMAVILPGVPLLTAAQRAETIREKIAAYNFIVRNGEGEIVENDIRITASFGVSELVDQWKGLPSAPEKLMEAADNALYEAKGNGRNQVRSYASQSPAAAEDS